MKHYKSHVALFSFSRRFCTRPFEALGCLLPAVERASPQAGQKDKALPPHPGMKLPLTNTEPTRENEYDTLLLSVFIEMGPNVFVR